MLVIIKLRSILIFFLFSSIYFFSSHQFSLSSSPFSLCLFSSLVYSSLYITPLSSSSSFLPSSFIFFSLVSFPSPLALLPFPFFPSIYFFPFHLLFSKQNKTNTNDRTASIYTFKEDMIYCCDHQLHRSDD